MANIIVEDHRNDRPYYADLKDSLRVWCKRHGYVFRIRSDFYGAWVVHVWRRWSLWGLFGTSFEFNWPKGSRLSVYAPGPKTPISEAQDLAALGGISKVEVFR